MYYGGILNSPMNHSITLALYGFFSGTPVLTFLAVFFAEWFPGVLILGAAAWTFTRYAFHGILRSFLQIFAPAVVAWFLVDAIKFFSPFPRPFIEMGFTPLVSVSDPFGSFPSGHATAFAALGMTIFLRDRKMGWWFLGGALVVGLARIAAGVHYPLDILVGLLFGAAIAFFFHGLFRKPKICKKAGAE